MGIFGPKKTKLFVCLKIGTHGISRILILIPTLVFWNSDLKIHFWANLGQKSHSCSFCLKIGTHGILRMLIFFPTLIFWISNPKIVFWANLGQNSQSCPFCLKIGTHGISSKLILIPTVVFWISKEKSIWGKFGPKKSKLSVLSENWYTWYLEDADPFFNICFLNFKPKTYFWSNLGQKIQICPFYLKIGTHSRCRFLFRNYFSEFYNLNPFLGRVSPRKWNCLFRLM